MQLKPKVEEVLSPGGLKQMKHLCSIAPFRRVSEHFYVTVPAVQTK